MVDFWSNLNLFNPDQFAYLSGKSTLAQLLTCYNDWVNARNCSQQTDIIFLDLSNAFDSVQHEAACHVKGQLFRLVTRDFRRAPANNTQPNLIYHLYK